MACQFIFLDVKNQLDCDAYKIFNNILIILTYSYKVNEKELFEFL